MQYVFQCLQVTCSLQLQPLSPCGLLTLYFIDLSHPMTPYGIMVSHKLMGIYMGVLILGVIL